MVRLRLTGGTKAETTSRGEETGDQVDLIDLQGDSAQAETKKYKIGDQTDGFAKVSIQSLHEDVKEKPGIQKRDVKRKRPAEKKLQKKDGREEAYSSRPALQPCGDEIVRAREEAFKKILPALVVIAGTQHLTSSVVTIPVNQYVHAKIAKEAGLHAGTWEGASVYNSVKLGLVPP
ncbi:hypothetical protein C1H46_034500 [Malus baccata]|uniref:Uncharacterized protein n=1 Tax=Malus baccata TaxID=106549 RepID=A0A540L0E0_MALBA|nr:hypothetical protein C1H46_034500 [Malus baccata]